MPSVRLKEHESVEGAIRRFKRTCEKAGVLAELRKREAYEKPTAERKRMKAAAVKRYQKKQNRVPGTPSTEGAPRQGGFRRP